MYIFVKMKGSIDITEEVQTIQLVKNSKRKTIADSCKRESCGLFIYFLNPMSRQRLVNLNS